MRDVDQKKKNSHQLEKKNIQIKIATVVLLFTTINYWSHLYLSFVLDKRSKYISIKL